MILQNSQASLISLESELESLELYLSLEVLRFDYHFDYRISVEDDLDISVLKIPPLIIQPFVENAIWHGLMNLPDRQAGKEADGHLSVNIEQENSTLICTITDNGIGRRKAAELKENRGKHKSMGMQITESRIAMMQKMNGENKSIEIKDLLEPDGSSAGTEVIIKIPAIYD